MKKALLTALALLAALTLKAQEDNLGTWSSLQVCHQLNSTWYGNLRLEYRTITATDDAGERGDLGLNLWFARATFGAKLLPWLKADLGVDRMETPSAYKLRLLPTATLSLKQGALTVALRERYVAAYTPSAPEGDRWSHVMRSHLKVGYNTSGHLLAPYLAVEVYGWQNWQQTHYFAGTQLKLTKRSTVDLFYLFATSKTAPDAHILGFGYDLNI